MVISFFKEYSGSNVQVGKKQKFNKRRKNVGVWLVNIPNIPWKISSSTIILLSLTSSNNSKLLELYVINECSGHEFSDLQFRFVKGN